MKNNILRKAEKYIARRHSRRLWQGIVGSLACVVVFLTAYALVLPAAALENPGCGLEEHTHSQACYTRTAYFKQTDSDAQEVWTDSNAQTDSGEADSEGEGFILHTHSSDCYDSQGTLTCGLKEIILETSSNCYIREELTCGKEEHTHTALCALTQKEQEEVQKVIAMIDALPTLEELEQTLAGYEAAEDWDGYDACLSDAIARARAAYTAYSALTGAQKQAVTNADKLLALELLWDGVTLDVAKPLTDDGARVTKIEITSTATGTAPFDMDDAAGNDSSPENSIVRSFDTVTYNFEVTMEPYENTLYSEARVKLEFVLPVTSDQAVFDQSAMGWMDQTGSYAPSLTKETRTIDGKETECQVLTCYKYLLPSPDNTTVVPGTFGENLTVNVKSMKNGETFTPIISAAMEHGTWNGECVTHEKEEKVTVDAGGVTVSAAPKYNVQLGKSGTGHYKSDFDFNTGNEIAKNYGDAYNIGTVTGRMCVYGVTIQLYNDNPSKGFKGIELPQGEISFDLRVSSRFTITVPNSGSGYEANKKVDTTDMYTPLLWSCRLNETLAPDKADGRVISSTDGQTSAAPGSIQGTLETECYQSGTWTGTQEEDIIHVTISGYVINVDKMPIKNSLTSPVAYGEDLGIGCFSAGAIWIVQPFNELGEGSNDLAPYDIVEEYGSGTFTTTVEAINMKATSISGEIFEDSPGTNYRQMKQDDDHSASTLDLTRDGNLINRIAYRSSTRHGGVGVSSETDGLDFATIGTDFNILSGFSYAHQYEEGNRLCWGTNLAKFYGSAIELTQDTTIEASQYYSISGGMEPVGTYVYYATKGDGSDWESDYELQSTYEDGLVFYESLSDIPEGHYCVGILFCVKEDKWEEDISKPTIYHFQPAKVRDDPDLAGKTFMLASTTRVWTESMFDEVSMTPEEIPDWSDTDTSLADFPSKHYTHANIIINGKISNWYQKETYTPEGAEGNHNSNYMQLGDTLLVIGYKAGITKTMSQKNTDNEFKTAYDLGAEQRVVDFTLQPSVNFDQAGADPGLTTTVTIVDTLPKDLSYVAGSAYFGGTYEQTSVHGGTRGEVTGGTRTEPVVSEGEGGATILTWIMENVAVGELMDPIYYSAYIGNRDNPEEDVPQGTTNFKNTVRISATHDMRAPTLANGNYAEAGFQANRGSASAFGKYSTQRLVEPDGTIDYVVYFDNNNLTEASVVLLDTMPYNGVGRSTFNGTYTVTGWKLDVGRCTAGNLKVYYTMDAAYKAATTKSLNSDEESAKDVIEGWTFAEIGSDGTIIDMNGKKPVAWGIVGTLGANQSIRISMQIKLDPAPSAPDSSTAGSDTNSNTNIENNYYVNTVSSDQTAIRAETGTVNRSLEGLTWKDKNANGIRDEDESSYLSGIKVELLKLKDNGDSSKVADYEPFYYIGTSIPVEIETGKQVSVRATGATDYGKGRYKFNDLPAGTYAVRFSDGSGTSDPKISEWIASPVNQGSDDSDSDGIAIYSDNHAKLESTVILDIQMPAAQAMSVLKLESKHHDSGFYEKGFKLPDTGGDGSLLYTIGGLAAMTSAALSLLYQSKRRSGL